MPFDDRPWWSDLDHLPRSSAVVAVRITTGTPECVDIDAVVGIVFISDWGARDASGPWSLVVSAVTACMRDCTDGPVFCGSTARPPLAEHTFIDDGAVMSVAVLLSAMYSAVREVPGTPGYVDVDAKVCIMSDSDCGDRDVSGP